MSLTADTESWQCLYLNKRNKPSVVVPKCSLLGLPLVHENIFTRPRRTPHKYFVFRIVKFTNLNLLTC